MAGNRWTAEKIIAEIRRLYEQGVDLSPTGIRKTHSALFSSARSKSHFGSWRAAIKKAGLDYSKIKRGEQVWSKEKIIRELVSAYERGEDLLSADFKQRHKKLYSAACAKRYFGSWRKAIEAAGLDYQKIRGQHFWSKEKIIQTIRELKRQGHPLNWSAINKDCPSLYRAARRKENFGSWKKALRAAGVDVALPAGGKQWTTKRIIEEIRRLHRMGEDLSQKAVMRKHGALLAAAKSVRYFGTWRAAVEAAGIDYNSVRRRRGRAAARERREKRALGGEQSP